ncbi:efflux RND transporter periplasmic adaptor subunit, partial [Patescibacteria group bacterium]|nr:efflux RND transporter periplasmic adaptor subunit [Patescibacteria group bacterium]
QASGIVRRVLVKEGDNVKRGQLLASLNQDSAFASLTTAKGSLGQAQANYDKLMVGATVEDVKTVEDKKISAEQDLAAAYGDAQAALEDVYIKMYNAQAVVIGLQSDYFYAKDQEAIRISDAKTDILNNMSALKSKLDTANATGSPAYIEQAVEIAVASSRNIISSLEIVRNMCDEGVYYNKISSTDKSSLDTQRGYVNTALANSINSQQAIASAKIALTAAENQLAYKKAPPTKAEIDAASAQILSAQGQVYSAQATLNSLILTAPDSGTITQVDAKVGEQATVGSVAIILQDVGNIRAEANVSEASIAFLVQDQIVDYTFDALGPDRHFQGRILAINPASTVISGVVNYKVTASLDNILEVKPGMTVNMTVMTAEKGNVLAVPSTAIISKDDGKYVRVTADDKSYQEVKVETGLMADGGMVEIVSGLEENQKIITYIKL